MTGLHDKLSDAERYPEIGHALRRRGTGEGKSLYAKTHRTMIGIRYYSQMTVAFTPRPRSNKYGAGNRICIPFEFLPMPENIAHPAWWSTRTWKYCRKLMFKAEGYMEEAAWKDFANETFREGGNEDLPFPVRDCGKNPRVLPRTAWQAGRTWKNRHGTMAEGMFTAAGDD